MIRPFDPALPGERAFVVDSWLTSFRKAAWAGMLTSAQFHHVVYGPLVSRILVNPDVQVLVSTDDATGLLLGWAAYDPKLGFDGKLGTLHYVFVKQGYREDDGEPDSPALDLMRAHGLASGKFFWFTFRTQAWETFYRRHRLNCRHKHHLVKLYENQGS